MNKNLQSDKKNNILMAAVKVLTNKGYYSSTMDDIVAESSDYKNIKDLAKAITDGDATVKDVPGLKRVFRLHPPRGPKGWGGIKRTFTIGGALGPRGTEIEALIERMI